MTNAGIQVSDSGSCTNPATSRAFDNSEGRGPIAKYERVERKKSFIIVVQTSTVWWVLTTPMLSIQNRETRHSPQVPRISTLIEESVLSCSNLPKCRWKFDEFRGV
uniref:Uncharacterized protein n=1 Tax=Caenorhabditis japonica TaxID=281687 RepID=A0A8R1IMG7_CAEJA